MAGSETVTRQVNPGKNSRCMGTCSKSMCSNPVCTEPPKIKPFAAKPLAALLLAAGHLQQNRTLAAKPLAAIICSEIDLLQVPIHQNSRAILFLDFIFHGRIRL